VLAFHSSNSSCHPYQGYARTALDVASPQNYHTETTGVSTAGAHNHYGTAETTLNNQNTTKTVQTAGASTGGTHNYAGTAGTTLNNKNMMKIAQTTGTLTGGAQNHLGNDREPLVNKNATDPPPVVPLNPM
jgi:hypothetical protein